MSEPLWWPAPHALGPVHAQVALPGSKSLTNRELILSAIAEGPSVLHRALRSRDTDLMAGALRTLGAQIDSSGDDWTVTPASPGTDYTGAAAVDCGLAGTIMRFVPPVAALGVGEVTFDGDPHARTRPMGEVIDGLRGLGVEVTGGPGLPFTVHATGGVRGGRVVIDASASSQFISALLLAAPAYAEGVDVGHEGKPVPSLPHIDMTVAALRARGVEVEEGANQWRVFPGPVAARDVTIEPDLSNAAPFAALAMVSGGTIVIRDWPAVTTQAGDELRGLLALMGATVERVPEGLRITGGGLHGIDVDLHDHGELTPVVAALCALADSPSTLRGIAHIRGHETDRLAALQRELAGLGADVSETDDGLRFGPASLHSGRFHTYADHRMAQAAVVLGAAVPGVLVENVSTTAKTFPGFEQVWAQLFDSDRVPTRG